MSWIKKITHANEPYYFKRIKTNQFWPIFFNLDKHQHLQIIIIWLKMVGKSKM